MREKSSQSSASGRLARATDQDLKLSAEAVVDAAICCENARNVSEHTRQILIEAVHHNPELTARLFDHEVLNSNWC